MKKILNRYNFLVTLFNEVEKKIVWYFQNNDSVEKMDELDFLFSEMSKIIEEQDELKVKYPEYLLKKQYKQ